MQKPPHREEAVDAHLQRLRTFKQMFPQFAGMTLYGAVAGMGLDADARKLAESQGLFVIAQNEVTVEITNAPGFQPARFLMVKRFFAVFSE